MDTTELTTLIVGGDWNCTLTKKDKNGGDPWKQTSFKNCVLISMEMFNLIDEQRAQHPNTNIYAYFSNSLWVKSTIDFLLVAKNTVRKKSRCTNFCCSGIVYLELAWPKVTPRGPGFWKFNNSLLDDHEYVKLIQDMYPHLREKYNYILDKRLFWEMLKMEIRSQTIAFAEGKSTVFDQREVEVRELLDKLDDVICNSGNLEN